MDFISKLRTVRAIERSARSYGFTGDSTLDERTIPPLGTLGEQLAMICVGLDSGVRCSQMSSKDATWTRQRLRSAVLGKGSQNSDKPFVPQNSAEQNSATTEATKPARRRAW